MKARLNCLWRDDRKFGTRLLIALAANFSFAFLMLFFTPVEMFLGNVSDVPFEFSVLLKVTVVTSLAYVVIATAVMLLLRGKIFDFAAGSVFAFTVASYIQSNFLNGDLGTLNGETVRWQDNLKPTLLGFAVWLLILLVPFAVRSLSRNTWQKVVVFVSVLLVIMQGTAFVSLYANADLEGQVYDKIVSRDGLYEVFDEGNVIVFVLDYFDNMYAEQIEEEYPDVFDELEGFTRYTDYESMYRSTMPSVPYLLTAVDWDPTRSLWEYPEYSYSSSSFLDDLHSLGARVNVYTKGMYVGTAGYGKIDNVTEDSPIISETGVFRAMAKYTLYKTLPRIMKAPFWLYTDDIISMSVVPSADDAAHTPYEYDDALFGTELRRDGITVVTDHEEESKFTFIHMFGTHYPWSIDENGEACDSTTLARQGAGCFKLVSEYLRDLKDAGVYDDATIIIMSDHGVSIFNEQEVGEGVANGYIHFPHGTKDSPLPDEFTPTPIMFIKKSGDGKGALKYSAAPLTQSDFHATIIEALGGDGSAYGPSFFDFAEGDERTRYYYFREAPSGETYERSYEYAINGDSKILGNWSITENHWERTR